MNFKQKIMCLGLLGLISQSILGSEGMSEVTKTVTENVAPMVSVATDEVCRQIPYWFAYPYFFGEDFVKVGGKACGHMGSALGYMGNALGETWEATKEGASFVGEYPKGTATIAAVIALIWLYYSYAGRNVARAGQGQGRPQAQPGSIYNFFNLFNFARQ